MFIGIKLTRLDPLFVSRAPPSAENEYVKVWVIYKNFICFTYDQPPCIYILGVALDCTRSSNFLSLRQKIVYKNIFVVAS